MIYLFVALIIFGTLTAWTFYETQNAHGDDFGAALPFLFCAAVTFVLSIVYFVLAMWNHRFF